MRGVSAASVENSFRDTRELLSRREAEGSARKFFAPRFLFLRDGARLGDSSATCPSRAHDASALGTYGLAWAAGTSAPFAGKLSNLLPFPFPNVTPVDGSPYSPSPASPALLWPFSEVSRSLLVGLLRCGDSCFPGIGTPSAAASAGLVD